jgi:hypothetical protein
LLLLAAAVTSIKFAEHTRPAASPAPVRGRPALHSLKLLLLLLLLRLLLLLIQQNMTAAIPGIICACRWSQAHCASAGVAAAAPVADSRPVLCF